MADRAESLKVDVSATSVGIEVKGPAAPRATNALLDLISPFTNGAGWLGQQISQARLRSAIRAASMAAEQLRQEGITKAQIPPKILLPWLDGASLETDATESLTDAWAGLFVRAAKSSDAVNLSYIETLKKLGKAEAELLQLFATDTSPFYSEKFYGDRLVHIFAESNPLRSRLIEGLEEVLCETPTIAKVKEFMEDFGIQGMCQVIFFSVGDARMISTKFFEEHEHAIANLDHLGLISVERVRLKIKMGSIDLIYFEITKYAFDLVWACQGVLTGRKAHLAKENGRRRERTNAVA